MILIGKELGAENLQQFTLLLDKTINCLEDDADKMKSQEIDWHQFELITCKAIKKVQDDNCSEKYSSWGLELISGAKFPDIVLELAQNLKFGVEVKTSKSKNNWKTLGGSIMESTRVPGVERIHVLFAKFNPFVVRHKNFEDCISDVAVTHSPRYVIDFDIDSNDSIFKKIGVEYQKIWQSEKPYSYFEKYFKEKAKLEKSGLWFVGGQEREIDDVPKLQVQFFDEITKDRKRFLIARSMVLFPELFKKEAEYRGVALWLMNMGVITTSLRDIYSAGSHAVVKGFKVPSKFKRLNDHIEEIKKVFFDAPDYIEMKDRYGSSDPFVLITEWKKSIRSSVEEVHQECLDLILEQVQYDIQELIND